MALVRWNRQFASPFSLLQSIQNDLARVLEETPLGAVAPPRWGLDTGAFVPSIDLYDHADHFLVRVDLPGMKKEAIEVSVIRNTLTVSGEKVEEKTEGKARSERVFGGFRRSMALPTPVDPEKVTATYRDGVLEIALPKTAESKPRQISIKA